MWVLLCGWGWTRPRAVARRHLSGGLVGVHVVLLLVRPCVETHWMANGSQHMTIGPVCYRCHGWAGSLQMSKQGRSSKRSLRRGYDFAVMRARAHSLRAEGLDDNGSHGCPSSRDCADCQAACWRVLGFTRTLQPAPASPAFRMPVSCGSSQIFSLECRCWLGQKTKR